MKIVNNYVSDKPSTLSFAQDIELLILAQEEDPTAVGGVEIVTPFIVGENKEARKTRVDKLVGVQTRSFQKAATAAGKTARIAGREDEKESVTLYFRLVEKILKTRKPVEEVETVEDTAEFHENAEG